MTRVQANLLLLLAGAIWGAGFIAQSTAMDALGPIWFIGLRFAMATVVALPFALWEKARAAGPVRRADIGGFVVTGIALFAAAAFQQVGLLTTTVTNSGFLTGLYVVFTPILTVLVLRRLPHWIVWPAAFMACLGIFLLSGGTLAAQSITNTTLNELHQQRAELLGQLSKLESDFGPEYPTVVALKAQISELDKQIGREQGRVVPPAPRTSAAPGSQSHGGTECWT